MTDEAALGAKLRLIEALFAGATTDGERAAAAAACERIKQRLRALEQTDPPIEFRFKLADGWSRRVFLALLRGYGITPYRRPRQRRTTVMARVPKKFVDETLWPEFEQLSETLRHHLDDMTQRVIATAIHHDSTEADEISERLLR